ncbi:MAG TPA: ROK family protein [Euzebyales bacterium]|nr:ROK family protein [Euzebyales bacterium]
MTVVAGIDIGGTNTTGALVTDDHEVVERAKRTTPVDGPDAVIDMVIEMVKGFGDRPSAVGIGVPGPVSDGVVTRPPNLAHWPARVELGPRLSSALGLPVEVGNDANVGALAEWVAGAGRGARFLLGVWLGTGVGGGLILDGRPYTGAFGGAGEFGHMVVHQGGAQCGCGRRGCIEAYAGRAAMERSAAMAVAGGRGSTLFEIRDEKGKDRITSSVWSAALDDDDPLAIELFDEAVDAVATGVASVVNLLDLDRVVLGGGITEKLGQDMADRVADRARRGILVPDYPLDVVVAELGDDSGIVGAAALARAAMVLS